MSKPRYSCPRCGGTKIQDNGPTIDCEDCRLEFDKEDLENIEDKSSILAISEKKSTINGLKE